MGNNRKRLIYNMAKKICDVYMTYTCSCAFVENNLVDKKVSQKFKELKDAIDKSIKDFKATLFIENLETKLIDKDYEVYNVELNLKEKEENK